MTRTNISKGHYSMRGPVMIVVVNLAAVVAFRRNTNDIAKHPGWQIPTYRSKACALYAARGRKCALTPTTVALQ